MFGDKYIEQELKNIEINNKYFQIVLDEFQKQTGLNFNFREGLSSADKVIVLKNQFVYESEYNELFFKILEKYGYNTKHEIIFAIKELTFQKNPNKNKKTIEKLLLSPYIQDIQYNQNKYKIESEKFGTIETKIATQELQNNKHMKYYFQNNELQNKCHNNAYFMALVYKRMYTITALCKHYFKNSFYHSYSYSKTTNEIVDLAINSIMNETLYNYLFEPNIITKIKNENIEEELEKATSKNKQDEKRCHLLKIAFTYQYEQEKKLK